MTDTDTKTELVKLDLSVDEGYRGDVVKVTPERAKELFDARAARPAPAKYEQNALEDRFAPTSPNPVINAEQSLFGSTPSVTGGATDEDGADDDGALDTDD